MTGEIEMTYSSPRPPCVGIGHMDAFGISHTDLVGDIQIGPARCFGDPVMPPAVGDLETPP